MIQVQISNISVDFKARDIIRGVEARMHDAFVNAAKYVHNAAKNAIRTSPYPAKPGKPVHTRKGALRNAIKSRVSGMSAYVGISESLGNSPVLAAIAGIGEYGGTVSRSPHSYHRGEFGPIRLKKTASGRSTKSKKALSKRYDFIRLDTDAQVERANRLWADFYGRPKSTAVYPERPFLRSTLEKVMPIVLRKFFSATP